MPLFNFLSAEKSKNIKKKSSTSSKVPPKASTSSEVCSSGEDTPSSIDTKVHQFEELVEENSGGSFGQSIPNTNFSNYLHEYHFNNDSLEVSGSFNQSSRPTSRLSNYQPYQFTGMSMCRHCNIAKSVFSL